MQWWAGAVAFLKAYMPNLVAALKAAVYVLVGYQWEQLNNEANRQKGRADALQDKVDIQAAVNNLPAGAAAARLRERRQRLRGGQPSGNQ